MANPKKPPFPLPPKPAGKKAAKPNPFAKSNKNAAGGMGYGKKKAC